jgi:hypothetical protein
MRPKRWRGTFVPCWFLVAHPARSRPRKLRQPWLCEGKEIDGKRFTLRSFPATQRCQSTSVVGVVTTSVVTLQPALEEASVAMPRAPAEGRVSQNSEMTDQSEVRDQLWLPGPAFPGEQTMVFRNSRTRELVLLGMAKKRQVMRVRAVLTDQQQPLNWSLEEVLAFQPANKVGLVDGPYSMWKHYGGNRAVFFDLRADENGNLFSIEVEVSAVKPELALAYARAAVNQLLDSLTATTPHPLVIQRLELLSPTNNADVLAYQITMPHQQTTKLPRFGGILPSGTLSGVEAVLREALTNPSPYYRLLLSYRGFEGLQRIRRDLAAFVKKHSIEAPALDAVKLDRKEIAQHGFRGKVLGFETLQQLIDYHKELRDAAAHYFVGGRGSKGQQHLKFSSTSAHTYGRVAALMLNQVRRELAHLKQYHQRHVAPRTHLGMVLPVEAARDRYVVIAPDDESSDIADEFN